MGRDKRAIPLMWNRDGGLRYFKCFGFSRTVTSLQKTTKLSPQSHTRHHGESEKKGSIERPSGSLFLQHVRQSGKACGALLIFSGKFCCVFHAFYMGTSRARQIHMQSCYVSNRSTECFLFRVYVWVWNVHCLFSSFSVAFSPLVLCNVSHCQSAH